MGFLFEFFFSQKFLPSYVVRLGALMNLTNFVLHPSTFMHGFCSAIHELPLSFSCVVCALQNLSIYHFHFCRWIIVTMSCVMPFASGPNDYIKKIVKKEGGSSLNLSARGFITPLYVEVHELFNNDGLCNFTKKKIANKYDLCYLGMNLKHIRLPKDCTKEEIEKCFGLVVNKNRHRYKKCLDLEFIVKVQWLWMILYQKP